MRSAALLLLLVSCASQPPAGGTSSAASELRAAGLTVTDGGPVEQPFLSVKGRVYAVDGGDLQLYSYATEAEALADTSGISPDAEIEGVKVSWMAAPHFYRRGNTVAIYVGSDVRALAVLQRVLGSPFAKHP